MTAWYERPLDTRAGAHGELGVNGRAYRGGEFLPFYVPRAEMPQIEETDLNALIAFAGERGVTVTRGTADPKTLKNHQRVHWDPARAGGIDTGPCLISSDNYVLDGNHRWYAHLLVGKPVNYVRFGLEFEDAIALLFEFPRTTVALNSAKGE